MRFWSLNTGRESLRSRNSVPRRWFFKGHFPGSPIVPGVIIVEAMAQAGGVLYNASFTEERESKGQTGAYLAGLEKVRFRKAVYPNDIMKMDVRI